MGVRDRLIRGTVRVAVLALFVGIGLSFRASLNFRLVSADDGSESNGKSSRKEVELCRKLHISPLSGGADLISADRIYTRRLRKGPFTLAAREMVVERLDATLPESYFNAPVRDANTKTNATAKTDVTGTSPTPNPMAALSRSLKESGGGLMESLPRVVGVTVRQVRMSRVTDGTNAVPWLTATKGTAEKGGLWLENGWSVENGVTNYWKGAFLVLEPKIELRR